MALFTITVSFSEAGGLPNLETKGFWLSHTLSFSLSPFHEPWRHLQKQEVK